MDRAVVTLWMTFDPSALIASRSDRERLDAVADVDWDQPIRSDAQLTEPAVARPAGQDARPADLLGRAPADRGAARACCRNCRRPSTVPDPCAATARPPPGSRASPSPPRPTRTRCRWPSSPSPRSCWPASGSSASPRTCAPNRPAAATRYDIGRREPGIGLYRTVIGIIGASRVGRRVIELLRGYDVEVLLHDPDHRRGRGRGRSASNWSNSTTSCAGAGS